MKSNTLSDKKSSSENLVSKIELGIVNAWDKKAWWLWLLLPLSAVYGAISFARRKLYKIGLLNRYSAPVPVMVVGNITVGGSGKTPLIIELVKYLTTKNVKVGVISRGYGGDESLMPQLVLENSKPSEVGDEPCLIFRETGVTVAVSPNRQQAIECILQHAPDTQLIITDDGLQHYKLCRDIEWIVVDSSRGFGNKQLLPTGFLREPLSRLNNATTIYHITQSEKLSPISSNPSLTMHLEPTNLQPLQQSTIANNTYCEDKITFKLNSDKVYAVSGIGYPKRFFNTLKALGYDVIEKPMPDHHEFKTSDIKHLADYPIVITSKDAVKIKPLVNENLEELNHLSIWVLPVEAVLSDDCYIRLEQQLNTVGIKF